MKIEIDLADLGFHYDEDGDAVHNKTLDDAVVERAAQKVAQNLSQKRELGETIRKAVEQLVADKVTEALSKPIQRTTKWNEKQGEPVSVLELIRQHLETFLADGTSQRNYDRKPTSLAAVIEDATREVMGKELKVAVADAKAKIEKHVFDKALAAAVAALSKDK